MPRTESAADPRLTRASALAGLVLAASTGGAQTQVAELTVPGATGSFGQSISAGGDRVLIGAGEAAHVFERQPDGAWLQVQELTASDGGSGNGFGVSVSLAGDRALIGASRDDTLAGDAGAAYVFERQADGTWLEVQKLLAGDGAVGPFFGRSVALSGDCALIGADDGDKGFQAGAAYVFERQADGTWLEVQKLTASDGSPWKAFGRAVSLAGDRALIGSTYSEFPSLGVPPGAAYVFERQPGGVWQETARLTPQASSNGDYFGESVSIAGDLALAGASQGGPFPAGPSATYAFERQPDGTWQEAAKLGCTCGSWVSLSGNRALAGCRATSDSIAFFAPFFGGLGPAPVYQRQPDGNWVETKVLTSDAGSSENFGGAVAVSGDHAFVGGGPTSAGSVFVYEFSLASDVSELSLAAGGTQNLSLGAGPPFANEPYFLLGSLSGTSPGTPVDGVVLPLNLDPYLLFTAASPNTPPLAGSLGVLDPGGAATAAVTLAPGTNPALAGLTAHHAYLVFELTGGVGAAAFASSAATLKLNP